MRRGFLLAFTSMVILTAILLVGKIASLVIYIDFFLVVSLGYAWILAFHLSLLLALSSNNYSRSLPPALIHPANVIAQYGQIGHFTAGRHVFGNGDEPS